MMSQITWVGNYLLTALSMCAGVSITGEGYSGSLSNTPVVEPMRESLLDDPRRSVLDSLVDGLVTVYVFPSTAVVSDAKY